MTRLRLSQAETAPEEFRDNSRDGESRASAPDSVLQGCGPFTGAKAPLPSGMKKFTYIKRRGCPSRVSTPTFSLSPPESCPPVGEAFPFLEDFPRRRLSFAAVGGLLSCRGSFLPFGCFPVCLACPFLPFGRFPSRQACLFLPVRSPFSPVRLPLFVPPPAFCSKAAPPQLALGRRLVLSFF